MRFRSGLAGGVALALLIPGAALAQYPYRQTQIQIQYHQLVAPDGETTPAFLKIFDHIRKDCALIGTAFHKQCAIRQINIYTNANYGGDLAGSRMINATANLVLIGHPGPTGRHGAAAAASAPSSAAPRK